MLSTYDIDVLTGRNDKAHQFANNKLLNNVVPLSWRPSSWKALPSKQLPEYPDIHALTYCQEKLKNSPPLVLASEIREFKNLLKLVAKGEAFLLQGGGLRRIF
ncbi:3-deoxy-7-phosphoheptulonate synthase [Shigella sp. FC1967]|uniref:3-deoxy-7-phosphoheptulonate synthase n=1 Tax=Shigella sp. FC1967 TaxID=1898041 RepID=UPI000A7506BA|nr:3-deoxy-7-phosphoheptulonate synthase [Shigella sp. FC1967]